MSIKNKLKDRSGSSLIIVISIMAAATILITVMATVAMNNYRTSREQFYKKQAYYTARSAIQSFLSSLSSEDTKSLLNNGAFPQTGVGSVAGMGNYTIKLEKNQKGDSITVTSTGTFHGETESIGAFLSSSGGAGGNSSTAIDPTKFAVFSKGNINFAGKGTLDIIGDTFFSGSTTLNGNNSINQTGNMLFLGSLTANGNNALKIEGNLISNGSLLINGNSANNVYYAGSGNTGTAVEEGKIGFDDSIKTAVKDWNSSYYSFDSGYNMVLKNGVKILYSTDAIQMNDNSVVNFFNNSYTDKLGNTSYNQTGTVTAANGAIADFEAKKLTLTDGTVIQKTISKTVISPFGTTTKYNKSGVTVTLTITKSGGAVINNVNPSDCIINADGSAVLKSEVAGMALQSCSSGTYRIVSSPVGSDTVTLDTTKGDIRLYAECDITIAVNKSIEIKGMNNVYIYLGNHKLIAKDGADIGKSATFAPAGMICIVSNEPNATVDLQEKSSMRGVVYLKNGTYTETDNTYGLYNPKFTGSITASNVTLTKKNKYVFEAPPLLECDTSLGDKYFIYNGTSGGGTGDGWDFVKYIKAGA